MSFDELDDGPHEFVALAEDEQGVRREASSWQWEIDIEVPQVTIVAGPDQDSVEQETKKPATSKSGGLF